MLFLVSVLRLLENRLNFAGGWGQASLGDDVSQVLNNGNQEHALFPREFETSIMKSCQDVAQILHVVCVVDTGNQDVVQYTATCLMPLKRLSISL